MANTGVTSLISDIINTLKAAAKDYNAVNNDKTLPETFHEAGRGLSTVREALKTANSQLQKRDQAGDPQNAISTLEACNAKAKLSLNIFEEVSEEPETSRFEHYKTAVGRGGRGNLVEALVVGMMNDICALAKDSAIEATMETQIKALRDAIDTLSNMEPSVPDEQSKKAFSHFGSGHQFNATGGTQNNNVGSGKQFLGDIRGETVTFN
ncbi:hypothetical protein EDB81DRAFT_886947 [Dactylonectria macrodidyma]|uniref:NACHT-NTPase and P-loop NTPases N-terminal domain-containing protein n=1 Tax=Dactylonectria macrodidyma TaxID=307937 RepID=A0A9P9E7U1_9HYPO|nr:hypothetical protein EDB81DRAFT_886947 [Dactylonectria macrodidyma]